MNKFCLFAMVILLQSFVGYAQLDQTHLSSLQDRPDEDLMEASGAGNHGNYFTGSGINVNDISGMVGLPFFIADHVNAIVFFKNGNYYKDTAIQFNWARNELHYNDNGKWYYFVDPVKSFIILDSSFKDTVATFRNGYPASGLKTIHSFYEVIGTGKKFQLLRYWTIHSQEIYHYGAPYTKEYSKAPEYYVYDVKQNELNYIELRSSSLEKALPDYAEKIKNFTAQNNIRRLKESDAIRLFDSLNKL